MSDKALEWRAHQAAWRSSGLTVAAYCRLQGLSYAQWMYWQRQLGASALIPIRVEASARARALLRRRALPDRQQRHRERHPSNRHWPLELAVRR